MTEQNVEPEERAAPAVGVGSAWLQAVPAWLIRHAAHRAPPDLSQRLEEEWRADLAVRSTILSRLRFALGCCWATGVIIWEHRPERIPVASPAVRPKAAIGYLRDESANFTRRSLTFFLVAGLHVVLFYCLMTGLAFKIIHVMPSSFQTRFLQPSRARVTPLPLPQPQISMSRLAVPLPEFPPMDAPLVTTERIPEPPIAQQSRTDTPPAIQVPPVHESVRAQGGPGIGFPSTDDYYPLMAKRLEEQGVATVRVCVGTTGRLTSDPTIEQTSGSTRLDEGALLLAKAGSGHYRATTEDGRAVNSCYAFRVRFALRTGR